MSQSPESVLSPQPILPYSPLAFGLVCSPPHSNTNSTPELEIISVLSPAVMAAHEDIAAQLKYLRVQTEAVN